MSEFEVGDTLQHDRFANQRYRVVEEITGIGELYRDDNFLVLEVEGGLAE